MFPILLFPEIDDKTAKFLHKVSMTEQGIRGVCNIYENAVANENAMIVEAKK